PEAPPSGHRSGRGRFRRRTSGKVSYPEAANATSPQPMRAYRPPHQSSMMWRTRMTRYATPGTDGSVVTFKPRYENFIGGEYVPPVKGRYFENPTPITGQTF